MAVTKLPFPLGRQVPTSSHYSDIWAPLIQAKNPSSHMYLPSLSCWSDRSALLVSGSTTWFLHLQTQRRLAPQPGIFTSILPTHGPHHHRKPSSHHIWGSKINNYPTYPTPGFPAALEHTVRAYVMTCQCCILTRHTDHRWTCEEHMLANQDRTGTVSLQWCPQALPSVEFPVVCNGT